MKVQSRNVSYSPAFIVLLLSITYAAVQFYYLEAQSNVDVINVLGEGFFTLILVVGLFGIQRINNDNEIYLLLMVGTLILFFYSVTDILDEFLKQPAILSYIFEDLFQILGAVLLVLGMIKGINKRGVVMNELQNAHDKLESEVTERTAELIKTNKQLQWENTKRKSAENEIEHSKKFIKSVIDCAAEAIITTNAFGLITTWNRSAEELYGYTSGEIVGTSIEKIYPKNMRGERKNWQKSITSGKTLRNMITKIIKKNGDTVTVNLSLAPLKDKGNKIIGTVGVSVDITYRLKMEDELRKKIDDLENWQKLSVGRELKMVDLKNEIEELKKRLEKYGEIYETRNPYI